ncbi:hypothetical protein [Embleya scabrispora]|uniref:hypothetical protein n=1 Tax=Embleya scabrispora TaxID=159449 RepID=UPI00036BDB89|nr:hypothetical protein [Embleya scabrispora]MYS79593.1 hypothetical protein [Streptomyces sp. SID5474]
MPPFDEPVDGVLAPRSGAEGTRAAKFDTSGDIYTEFSGFQYTIHLSREAVGWISTMEKLFDAYLEVSMEALEEVAPFFDLISAYIQAEVTVIEAVSETVPDGRVKLVGVIPFSTLVPEPDEGYVPPGGWNPPAVVNGLRWWTVNSINLYNNRWCFTATNSNPNASSVSSIYFTTDYDGNSMHINPRDFRDTYGWTSLRGHREFDSGLDTCVYVKRTGMWWLFNGIYCARTNGYGDTVTWSPQKLTDVWRGFARIANGEFGQDERDQWAGGVSCVTAIDDYYLFTAGNRVAFLDAGSGDFKADWPRPVGLTDVWPALENLPAAGIRDGSGPKAVCWYQHGNTKTWLLVFHSKIFVNSSAFYSPVGFIYDYLACRSDVANEHYSWNAMFNYLNGPWPYPRCD